MATFPTALLQLEESSLDAAPGVTVQLMASGKPNARNLYDVDIWQGNIVLAGNASDVDTLLSFYATNRDLTFTFVWDGDTGVSEEPGTYTAIFVGRPRKREIGPGSWRMFVSLLAWEP